jgi:hypothetical protein
MKQLQISNGRKNNCLSTYIPQVWLFSKNNLRYVCVNNILKVHLGSSVVIYL